MVKEENINKDIIQEKTIFVRTPCILYKNSEDGEITTSIPKGEQLDIIGYDKINNGKGFIIVML